MALCTKKEIFVKRILTVVGARPQFVKASVVSKALAEAGETEEIVLHTGQHFDSNMSDIFFNQLGIPRPDIKLDIHGGTHGVMTGRMLESIEKAVLEHKPDRVLVYGDTNSTLAGALAASKLHTPVAHIEAGLRSFNMNMPEEINRILTDQISDLLFCPTDRAVENLRREGFGDKSVLIQNVGDVMQDAALFFSNEARMPEGMNLPSNFVLSTLHRAENTDDPIRLKNIVDALNQINESIAPVILPLHPRTKKVIKSLGYDLKVNIIDPVGYLEMLWLLNHCGLVLTDSGGVQKEAYFFGRACVTMRDQTEWVELLDEGANVLVGADCDKIVNEARKNYDRAVSDKSELYGGGNASFNIAKILKEI